MPRLSQVKEKYGTLRMYWSTYPEGFDEIEEEALKRSAKTCEKCGKPGKIRGQGWLYCSCWKHCQEKDRDNLKYLAEIYNKKHKKIKRRKSL